MIDVFFVCFDVCFMCFYVYMSQVPEIKLMMIMMMMINQKKNIFCTYNSSYL